MAVTLLRTHTGEQRPYGYQVRFDLTDGVHIFCHEGVWKATPSEGEVATAVAAAIARTERELATPPDRTDRDRLDDTEKLVLKSIVEVNLTSDHVASLAITALQKAGIQARLAIIKNTLQDAFTALRET